MVGIRTDATREEVRGARNDFAMLLVDRDHVVAVVQQHGLDFGADAALDTVASRALRPLTPE